MMHYYLFGQIVIKNVSHSSYRTWNDSIIKNDSQLTYDPAYFHGLTQTHDCGNNKAHFIRCKHPFYTIKYHHEYCSLEDATYVFAPNIVDSQFGYQNWFEVTHLGTITNPYENGSSQNHSFVFKNFDTSVASFYFDYFNVRQIEGEFRCDNLHIGRSNNYAYWETNSSNNNNNNNNNSVNINEGLALAEYWKTYEINDICLSNIINENDIFSIDIEISQSDIAYCIDGFLAVINNESYVLNDQLKGGTILCQNCESYFYNHYTGEIFDYFYQGLYRILYIIDIGITIILN